jgi:LacI family transcriptional regulator
MTAVQATLADVASRAGVSLATASRAFSGSGGRRVRPELRDRVLRAAAELNYSPNASARAMVLGRTDIVGLVVHDIADPYFSAIASGVMAEAAEWGLLVTVASTLRDPHQELRYVELLHQQRARAVLLAGSRIDQPELLDAIRAELRAVTRTGGRVACLSQDVLDVSTVVVENRLGAAAMGRALHQRGYRRFVVLAGPDLLVTARDRAEGFVYGLAEAGLDTATVRVVPGAFTRDGAYAEMRALLDEGLDADCVFAVNDVMAVGAVAALRDHGTPVPEAIGVAGFDDIATLRDITPALSTVRVPLVEMGRTLMRLALGSPARAADEPAPVQRVRVPGEVILRASTPGRTPA